MTPSTSNAGVRITSSLRRAILDGQWEPGTRLPPVTLAEQFDVSTTIIREALTRLTGEGLVVVRPNRGFFVRELSLRELSDITELRCASEAIAVRLALTRGDLQWEADLIAAHHQLARTPRRSTSDPDHISEEWSRAHAAFHQILISACDCEPMTTLSANLATKTELYRRWAAPAGVARVREVEQEHKEILEAAIERDVEKTIQLLTMHYRRTVQVVLDAGLVNEELAG